MQKSLFGITEQKNSANSPTIPVSQNFQPCLVSKTFPTLFVLDTKGRLRSWEISVENRGQSFAVVTKHGLVGDEFAKVPNEYLVSTGTNIGRSNERTPFQQACFEAQAKWSAQIRAGYADDPEDALQDTLGSGISAPMLAEKYSPDGKLKGSKTLEKLGVSGKLIHVQPKLDGNRCLAKINISGIQLYTRKGDRFLPVAHIEEQLFDAYRHSELYGEEVTLDGELYSDEMSFNTMNGLLRKEIKSSEEMTRFHTIGYYIYDIMLALSYSERYAKITELDNELDIRLIPSYEIEATDENIREKMNQFLDEGYEGLMIRTLDKSYEHKRSWSLLKYKDFCDEEYRVIDIIEDVRATGIIGAFVLELSEPLKDRDGKEIKTFNAGIKDLSHDEARKILANKSQYIGRIATVEFFEKSEYGIPRFPKLKGFRMDV